mmetsp:Transcript_17837/g.35832  ORF Transcript_17837/g.35832 Transcript_17837/m.35832 type:complete len:236 (-) Transcript_17837:703-1410(-)
MIDVQQLVDENAQVRERNQHIDVLRGAIQQHVALALIHHRHGAVCNVLAQTQQRAIQRSVGGFRDGEVLSESRRARRAARYPVVALAQVIQFGHVSFDLTALLVHRQVLVVTAAKAVDKSLALGRRNTLLHLHLRFCPLSRLLVHVPEAMAQHVQDIVLVLLDLGVVGSGLHAMRVHPRSHPALSVHRVEDKHLRRNGLADLVERHLLVPILPSLCDGGGSESAHGGRIDESFRV